MATALHKPGQRVPVSGIFRVHHKSHRLMHEATLLRETVFPRCKHCGDFVRFQLLRSVSDKTVVPFRSGAILEECPLKRKAITAKAANAD